MPTPKPEQCYQMWSAFDCIVTPKTNRPEGQAEVVLLLTVDRYSHQIISFRAELKRRDGKRGKR